MSYEFNPNAPSFELPNPYRLENIALILGGLVVAGAGIATLLIARGALEGPNKVSALIAIGFGVVALLVGFAAVSRAFVQLKFFFGRETPTIFKSLGQGAAEKVPYSNDELKQRLREGALLYSRPSGPINGLLYALCPTLVTSAGRVREIAETQFANLLFALVTWLSFAVCCLLYSGKGVMSLLNLAYTAFAIFVVYRESFNRSRGQLSVMLMLVALILVPIFASFVPQQIALPLQWQTWPIFAALLLLATGALFSFLASISHLDRPSSISAACEQRAISFNAAPKVIFDELDRLLQAGWVNGIANLQRNRIDPKTSGSSGNFNAERFEESQPLPVRRAALSFGDAIGSKNERFLLALSLMVAFCLIAAAVCILSFTVSFTSSGEVLSTVSWARPFFAFWLLLIAFSAWRQSHELWGRLEFQSQFIWVEAEGFFRTANMSVGNIISGQVQSQASTLNVENMTLRVWVSDVVSIGYGQDNAREIVTLSGRPDAATTLADALTRFAQAQRSFVVPTNEVDMRAAQAFNALANNPVGGGAGQDGTAQQMLAANQLKQNPESNAQ
jgi:hypothetical protein